MHLGGIAHLVIDSTELKVSVKVSGKSKIWQRTASYLVEAPSGSWQQHTWNHPRRPVAKQRDWLRGIPQVNPTAPPEYQVAAADGAYAPPSLCNEGLRSKKFCALIPLWKGADYRSAEYVAPQSCCCEPATEREQCPVEIDNRLQLALNSGRLCTG